MPNKPPRKDNARAERGARFERPKKPALRVQTTTLWEYPSQHYGEGMQGDQRYVGATPSYVIWNVGTRFQDLTSPIVVSNCFGITPTT